MGQLLTLMVFGDAITVNNDNDVEDEEANGATISGPPGWRSATLRSAAVGQALPSSKDYTVQTPTRTEPGNAPANSSGAICRRWIRGNVRCIITVPDFAARHNVDRLAAVATTMKTTSWRSVIGTPAVG